MRLYNGFSRKVSSLLFIMAICTSFLYPVTEVRSDSFTLQAGYDDVAAIYIEPIAAQSATYIAGMPFNIEDTIVKYSNGGRGRTIAHFSVISNLNCKIAVEAENLKWESNPENPMANTPAELSYILNFDYNVAYTAPDGSVQYSANDTGFSVVSDKKGEGEPLFTGTIPKNTYLSIMDGSISFMFDEATSNRIHNTPGDVPVGTYKGKVTITLEDLK